MHKLYKNNKMKAKDWQGATQLVITPIISSNGNYNKHIHIPINTLLWKGHYDIEECQ